MSPKLGSARWLTERLKVGVAGSQRLVDYADDRHAGELAAEPRVAQSRSTTRNSELLTFKTPL